jgi:hypothetical protein
MASAAGKSDFFSVTPTASRLLIRVRRGSPTPADATAYFAAFAKGLCGAPSGIDLIVDASSIPPEDFLTLFGFARQHNTFLKSYAALIRHKCVNYRVYVPNNLFRQLVSVVTKVFRPSKPLEVIVGKPTD